MTITSQEVTVPKNAETAKAALVRAKALLPVWTPLVRVIARNPKLKVELTAGAPCTDGDTVYLRVPFMLAFNEHQKELCGKWNVSANKPMCPACAVELECDVGLFHEAAHIVAGSFTHDDPDEELLQLFRDRYPSLEHRFDRVALSLKGTGTRRNSTNTLMRRLAEPIPDQWPFFTWNSVEDVFVNATIIEARPGLAKIFASQYESIFRDGITQMDGSVTKWSDQHPFMQALVTWYLLASGLEETTRYLDEGVVQTVASNETLMGFVKKLPGTKRTRDRWKMALRILRELESIGLGPITPPATPPASPPEQDEEDDTQPNPKQESDPDAEEGEAGSEDGEEVGDGGSAEGDQEQTEESDTDSAGGSEAPEEDETTEGDSESQEGDAPSIGKSDDEADTEESDQPSGGFDADAEPEDSEDDDADDGDEGDAGNGTDTDDEDETTDDRSGISGSGSSGENEEVDGESEDSSDADDADDDFGDEGDDEYEDGDAAEDDGEPANYSESTSPQTSQPNSVEVDQDDEPDDAEGGEVELSIEDAMEAMSQLTGHDDFGDIDTIEDNFAPDEVDTAETELIKTQLTFDGVLDEVGEAVVGIDTKNYRHAWVPRGQGYDDDGYAEEVDLVRLGANGDRYKMPVEVAVSSAQLMRLAFAANKKAGIERNLQSGRRVDPRTLGSRVAVGDDRLFSRRSVPKKRQWTVLMGIDASGSTCDGALEYEKAIAIGVGDLLTDLGIPFSVHFHTAKIHSARGMKYSLVVPTLKGEDEQWKICRDRVAGLQPGFENLDGHTMSYYRKALERQTGKDKLLMYFTDGEMPAANKREERPLLEKETALMRAKGIHAIGVGVGTDSPKRFGLDTIRVDSVRDIPALIQGVGERLSRPPV